MEQSAPSVYFCWLAVRLPEKIVSQRPDGGWDAVNQATMRPVYVRSAQRLRREITPEQADALAEEGL